MTANHPTESKIPPGVANGVRGGVHSHRHLPPPQAPCPRLLTGEADKTIKIWREDPAATPETHPVRFNPDLVPKRY